MALAPTAHGGAIRAGRQPGCGDAERLPRLAYAASKRNDADPDVPTPRELQDLLMCGVKRGKATAARAGVNIR